MTGPEREGFAALSASFAAFLDRYERDQAEAKEHRHEIGRRLLQVDAFISEQTHLRARVGGAVLAGSVFLGMVALPVAMGWRWIWAKLTGQA